MLLREIYDMRREGEKWNCHMKLGRLGIIRLGFGSSYEMKQTRTRKQVRGVGM